VVEVQASTNAKGIGDELGVQEGIRLGLFVLGV